MIRADGKLTRGGRLMRTLIAACALAAALVLGPQALAEDSTPRTEVVEGSHHNFDTYTVVAGQTLWDIARAVGPAGSDPQVVIRGIVELNGLTSSAVVAGQQLLLPDYS